MAKNNPNDDPKNDFAIASTEGAPESRINKQQLIARVKSIFSKNVSGNIYKTHFGEELEPTANQKNILKFTAEKDVVIVDGPFGTGKTMWTTYMALLGLAGRQYNRIAITAPAVEAGENLGFLPGEANDKMLPYVNQILESFDDWIGKDLRMKLQEVGIIDIEPHAYLRGRTMKETFFILDESQNASGPQLMTALTRLGNGSTFVFMGDNRQNDRTNGDSAFVQFINRFADLEYAEYVGHITLTKDDICRHPFLKLVAENGHDGPLEQFETHISKKIVNVVPRNNGKSNMEQHLVFKNMCHE